MADTDTRWVRYTIPQVTVDGPGLDDATEASIKLLAKVEATGLPQIPAQRIEDVPPHLLHVFDWAGPWAEPHNPIPNPVGDAARELRELRAKWAAQGIRIDGAFDEAITVTHKTGRVVVPNNEAIPRLLTRGSAA